MMRKVIFILLALLILAGPIMAQGMEEPVDFGYTRADFVLVGAGVVVLGLLIVFGSALVIAIRRLSESLPPGFLDMIGGEEGAIIDIDLTPVLDELRELVENSQNPIDDILLEQIELIVRRIFEEARQEDNESLTG